MCIQQGLLIKPKMARFISIFFTTALAAIFSFPTYERTKLKDSTFGEPDEKHNQQKVRLVLLFLET